MQRDMKTKHGKNFKHGWRIVPLCLQIGERTTLISSNTYLTYKEGENNMFLIIREKTFETPTIESCFSIVGQYKSQKDAEEKRKAFRIIEDRGDVFFYITQTPLRLTDEVKNEEK